MKRLLTESQLVLYIKKLLKEQVEEVEISPKEYLALLRNVAGQAHGILTLRKFKGKKLVVVGDLNLSGDLRITDLGPIKVLGNLDVNNTKIKSLDDVEVTGHKSYWQTPYENVIHARKQKAKQDEQDSKREDGEWNLNNTDEEGEKAHAAFQYAIGNGELSELDDEQKEKLQNLKTRLTDLEQQMEAEEDEERYNELSSEFDEVEEEIDNLSGDDVVDVYDLSPYGFHYDMTSFESLSTGYEYAVGTISEADESLESFYEEMLDRPKEYFSKDYLSNYIDGDKVKYYFEDTVEDWVRESPDSYGVENQLSDDQEEEIWLLEMEKWAYENEGVRTPIKFPSKEENGRIFDFMDENEEIEFQYRNESSDQSRSHWVLYKDGVVVSPHQIYDDENTDEHKEVRDERISDIEYEIQEIKDNPDGDPSDEDIQGAAENYLDDIERDPLSFLEEIGYTDFSDFLNIDEIKDDLKNQADYGETLNGYNGQYKEITINGTDYIVMRVN